MKELHNQIKDNVIINFNAINDDRPIVELLGKDLNEAINILGYVGLNDAFIFTRTYNQLSDGQKYRFVLGKMIFENNNNTIIIDEFTSLLDRNTAKIISYNIQKWIRNNNKTLIVATTHTDIINDLKPNVLINKTFGDKIEIKYCTPNNDKCSLFNNIEVVKGTIEEFEYLEQLHYKAGKPAAISNIFTAKYNDEVAGSIIYVYPPLQSKARNTYTQEYKKSDTETAQKLNKELITMSRLVIHPKYRNIGLGYYLIQKTLPLLNKKYVEAVAVMGKYTNVFEKAGMQKVDYEISNAGKKIIKMLDDDNIDVTLANSKVYLKEQLNGLNTNRIYQYKKATWSNAKMVHKKFRNTKPEEIDNDELINLIQKQIPKYPQYYIWCNQNYIP